MIKNIILLAFLLIREVVGYEQDSVITLVVGYNAAALCLVSGQDKECDASNIDTKVMENLVLKRVDETNNALCRAKVPAFLQLTGIHLVRRGNANNDVNGLRYIEGADVGVVIRGDDEYGGEWGKALGDDKWHEPKDPEDALFYLKSKALEDSFIWFAHEFGHILGAEHTDCEEPGWWWREKYTIMCKGTLGYSEKSDRPIYSKRLARYSTASADYLRENAPVVATFSEQIQESGWIHQKAEDFLSEGTYVEWTEPSGRDTWTNEDDWPTSVEEVTIQPQGTEYESTCLDADNDSVFFYPCDVDSSSQRWLVGGVYKEGNSLSLIKHKESGKCLKLAESDDGVWLATLTSCQPLTNPYRRWDRLSTGQIMSEADEPYFDTSFCMEITPTALGLAAGASYCDESNLYQKFAVYAMKGSCLQEFVSTTSTSSLWLLPLLLSVMIALVATAKKKWHAAAGTHNLKKDLLEEI